VADSVVIANFPTPVIQIHWVKQLPKKSVAHTIPKTSSSIMS